MECHIILFHSLRCDVFVNAHVLPEVKSDDVRISFMRTLIIYFPNSVDAA
jgi:hypothetical protein